MTEFKAGDKVIVAAGAGWYEGDRYGAFYRSAVKPGLADVTHKERKKDVYTLSQNGEGLFSVHAEFLTLAVDAEPEPKSEPYTFDPGGTVIDFAEIKVGDIIAAITYGDWRIGEAQSVEHYAVSSSNQAYLAYSDTDTTEIRLLHRPEPELDPEQVAAMREVIGNLLHVVVKNATSNPDALAEALVKAGVTVNV